ncbi:MAG: hypothetical protein QG657_979, partial [Acidobacteriota bacterium]|nr:hypothetical protein [Acidobacteriota bacterium]
WLEQYETEIPVLNLPTDYVRPRVQDFGGRSIVFEIGPHETTQLKELAFERNTTLYMIVMATFGILISKLSGQEDIVIGTPTTGRRHVDLESIIGMFVNTLALRHFPKGEKSFPGFLNEVTIRTLEAFENQDYPLEDLVEKVVKNRDMGRNPLFDVMFILQNIEIPEIVIPGLKLSSYPYERSTAKFDIILTGVEKGDNLCFDFEYCSKLFTEPTIRQFSGYFKKIVSIVAAAAGNPGMQLSEIEIISEEEKNQILIDFNSSVRDYPKDKNINQLFEEQVKKAPDRIAMASSFHQFMTYQDMYERVEYLGWILKNKGVGANCVVGLMIERSIEMIVGILGILRARGAYLPIDPDYPQERIDYMLKDSGVKIMIKRAEERKSGRAEFELSSFFPASPLPHFLASDSSNLCYIIYTSGSTGKPKGVMVQEEGFINLLHWYIEEFNISEDDNNLLIAPISFDLSQKNLFSPFLVGGCLTLASPGIPDYRELTEIIQKEHITIINCAPSVLYPLIESNDDAGYSPLHSLRAIILGGEPIRFDRLLPWVNSGTFHCEIINTYGPTECTDIATFYRIPIKSYHLQGIIPIGKPIPNVNVYILDKYRRVLPVKIPGELCIGGIGLSKGYHNNEKLTEEKFIDTPHLPEKKVYCTGDITHWLPDGNIEFLGRIDHQVKVRGFRIELGEIESELAKHERIKEVVVTSIQDENGDNNLCAYLVPQGEQQVAISVLREYLRCHLADYLVPSYFVYLDRFPLTPSGKIDRMALPKPELKVGERYSAPRDMIEAKLVDMWSEILCRDALAASQMQKSIGIDDNFFQLGGHSLKAAIMTAKVHKALHVEIPLARVFETPTIRALSGYIRETNQKGYDPVWIVPEREYYELSSAQKRLYILQKMEPDSTGYNMPLAMSLIGELDGEKLEEIFGELIARHESLRTSFESIGDRPMQKIHEKVDFKIEYYATSGLEISRFVKFFDLSRVPLLRVGLIKIDAKEHILLIDMHHIIADGTSLAILYKEMMALYKGIKLCSLNITYKDYAAWQNRQKYKEILNRQEKYWLEQFAGELPVLNLPTDYPRPVMQSFEGSRVDFELGREETELLKKLAQGQGATLYMALLAACNTWFSKLSSEEDIVIGTPIAGRNREEFQGIIGMFINTLPLRNYPVPGKIFLEFLKEVKARTLDALGNQDYQFEDLVEKVVVDRDTSRNPIFDIMFVFQNMEIPSIDIPGLTLRPYEYDLKTSKFDLNLAGVEIDDRLTFSLEYSTKLFKEETIRKCVGYFKNIIHAVNVDPAVSLADIEIIDQEEKKRILEISSGITEPIDLNETIHGWFEKVVLGNEHKTALVFRDGRITYGELNRRANRLASLMRSRGVGPDKVVGLMVKRAFEMVIGMLGIMKAGGAYLPIDPGLPGVRKEIMIEDGNISALATNFDIEEDAGYIPRNIDPIDIRNEYLSQGTGENLQPINKGSDLVYVLFTSGSTGTPKGVMLEHTNLVNLVKFQLEYTNIDFSKVLQFTTISFDVSFQEIFTTLLGRGELYLIPEETRNHIPELFEFISKNKIKTLFLPMSFIKLIFSQDDYSEIFPGSVEHIVTAGEQVVVSDTFRNYLTQHQVYLHNHYGPAETHVITTLTMNSTEGFPEFPAIGKPIMNTRIYILDKGKHLQPAGIAGELYAGGLQVGRGYLNNRELTVERFNRSYRTNRAYIFYRTGDLARWLTNGNIEFLGRIDHQVKIRGIRVEPGEIENHLKKIAFIKEAIVAVKQQETGDKYLCAYVVLDTAEELDISKLRNILSVNLPDYMIPAYFVPVDIIPLTPSGKIDRKALPEPVLKVGEKYTAPRDEIENKMVEIWSEILSVGREAISVTGNFFHLGGHSLKAIGLINKIHKTFGVTIALQDVFRYPTIADISRIIKNSKVTGFKDIEKQPQKEYYELSYSQKRLWYISKTEPDNPLFNMPGVTTLFEAIDEALVRRVVERLTSRHESLRTSFKEIDKEPVQVIEQVERIKIDLIVIDLSGITGTELEKRRRELFMEESMYIFNLEQPPLFKIKLIKCGTEEYDLVFNLHHIISDGWSTEILKQEFRQLIDAFKNSIEPPGEPLEIQYKDYAAWQNQLLKDAAQVGKANEFWRGQLSGNLPALNLPYDFSRVSGVDKKDSAGFRSVIPNDITIRLRSIAESRQASLFMVLLAGFNLLLAQVTGQEEIMIAIPAAARQHEALKNIIGLFVNTLILCNRVVVDESFFAFFNRLQDNTFKVLDYQDIPLESICGQLKIKYPELSVFFNMVNTSSTPRDILDNLDSFHREKVQDAKFDIVCYLTEYKNGIEIDCHYYKNRFKPVTIEKLMERYREILAGIASDPVRNIGEYFMSGKKRKLKRGGTQ